MENIDIKDMPMIGLREIKLYQERFKYLYMMI